MWQVRLNNLCGWEKHLNKPVYIWASCVSVGLGSRWRQELVFFNQAEGAKVDLWVVEDDLFE